LNGGGKVNVSVSAVDQAYSKWIELHIGRRDVDSERRRRLVERNDHGENSFIKSVWWPVVGKLDELHPEYEVNDYRDGSRFLDFAYIRGDYRISIEIDGYNTHQRHASRRTFGDDRFRQNQLVLDEWKVIRFSYDDIVDKPRQCQQFIQQLLGKLYGVGRQPVEELDLPTSTCELLRWAIKQGPGFMFSPMEARLRVRRDRNTVYLYLNSLRSHGYIEPVSGQHRIRSYRLTDKALKLHL
jgi:hypothetical protein